MEACVCATLRQATRAITQLYDLALRPSGLRSTQFQTLAEIRGAGETTVGRLSRKLGVDQTTLTRNLAVLIRQRLLEEVPKPDGRLKTLRLTVQGEEKLTAAIPLWEKAQKQATAALGTDGWAVLREELQRLSQISAE